MTKDVRGFLTLHNGKAAQPLKPGQLNTFKAHAGKHYRVIQQEDAAGRLADDVIAIKHGDDLHLTYADGTQVVLENYYVECQPAAACDVAVPGDDGRDHFLSDAGTQGTALDGGATLVYAHGD